MTRWCVSLLAGLAPIALAACAEPAATPAAGPVPAPVAAPQAAPAPSAAPGAAQAPLPRMVVHKTATCGCCGAWVEHVRDAGFEVETIDHEELGEVKSRLGIPYGKGSCHTAEIGGYFIEGHVPAGDIRRLLAERPDARGLTLPGMPMGSPGMEMPDGSRQAFTVELVGADGGTAPFAQHPAQPPTAASP
ncbi:DUF411 domain-containing protein [Luteimonas sp. Y-2-2-4F]|nr:DUF411 domain-containing protein [Luteimonas sp. Y-2-2-4F]MCD9032448.1 DUF411 domain-containing protein [Luteimonas sp. Y-2-2-4F]